MKSTYATERSRWESIKADFVSSVHLEMMRDQSMRRRYAYVKPSQVGVWGELAHTTDDIDSPDGFELITAEHVPMGDKATIARWLERFAGRLPVYPL